MFCQNCGKEVNDGAKFCVNCGTQVSNEVEKTSIAPKSNPFGAEKYVFDQGLEKKSILTWIRGIPFVLLFLTFFLPLIVVSCPVIDKDIAGVSVYRTADIMQSVHDIVSSLGDESSSEEINSQMEELSNDATTLKAIVFSLFTLAGLAFFFSFAHRITSAILGILGIIDLTFLTFALCGVSKNQNLLSISPADGFYFGCLLFIVGIVMNFIPAGNMDGGVKKGMNVMAILYVLLLLAMFIVPPLYLSLTTVKVDSQTWKKKDECKRSECLYTWSEAKKACPKGFHLPRLGEWQKLFFYANSSTMNSEFVIKMLDEKIIDEFYKKYNIDISEANFDTEFSWEECYQYREDSPGTEYWTASELGEYAVVIASMETSTFLYCDKKSNLGKNKVRCIKD